MRYTTYQSVAERIGQTLCIECDAGNHERGFTDERAIHWRERRVTRAGLYRFLIVASHRSLEEKWLKGEPRFRQIYERSKWANDVAFAMLNTVIPRRITDLDRAKVEYLMRRSHETDETIKRWTRRRTHAIG